MTDEIKYAGQDEYIVRNYLVNANYKLVSPLAFTTILTADPVTK
jgi:hypothetical protein